LPLQHVDGWEVALTERQFWDRMRVGLIEAAREVGRPILLQRIETTITAGVPDVYFATPRSRAGWVELKVIRQRRQRPELRPAQLRWCGVVKSMGVPVFVVARSELTGYVHVWSDPATAAEHGIRGADFHFPPPTSWTSVLEVLEGGIR